MNFKFHKEAEKEFFSTIEYYESCETGLGEKFSNYVFTTIGNILENPHTWRIFNGNIRRLNVNNFPYAILYQIVNDEIRIMAIMNTHRKPNYWKKRI